MLGNGSAKLLVSLLYIFAARSVGPDEFGLVATAIGLGMAGAGFVDLGSNEYWVRELASRRISQAELDTRMTARVVTAALVGAVVIVAVGIRFPVFIATGFLLISTNAVQTVLVPLRASQRAESVARLVVFGRLIAVAAFWCQTTLGASSGLALWTSLVIGDVAFVVSGFFATATANRPRIRIRPLRNPWSGIRWYAVSAISTNAQQLDLPIVAATSGAAAAGIYGGVNRWNQPILIAIGSFNAAAAPIIAAAPRLDVLKRQLLRASWLLGAAMVLSILVYFAAPWIVVSLLGSDFADSVPILRLLALAVLLSAVTQPLIVTLQARHRDHVAAGIVATAVSVHLITVAVLSPKLGALGAGIGFLSGQLVAFIGTVACVAVVIRRRRRITQ